jgi:tetratricopeptide (TPR) repeat protein
MTSDELADQYAPNAHAAPVQAEPQRSNDIEARLDRIDQELGMLQIEALRPRPSRPWFRDPNTLTAVLSTIAGLLAFLLSFTTTFFQYQQNQQQNIHDARTELRGLILRLSALPRENIVYQQTVTDTLAFSQISSLNQAENAVLAKQAAEIMATIPDHVTASEYLLVSNAMLNSSLPDQALELLGRAALVVRDANDGVAVLRSQGRINMLLGNVEAGREAFRRALAIFDTFPTTSALYRDTTNAQTELNWAETEFSQGNCAEAKAHFQKAEALARSLTNQSVPNQILRQIDASRPYIEQCQQRPASPAP